MLDPAEPNRVLPPIEPCMGLGLAFADQLIPLFASGFTGSDGVPLAQKIARRAIEAYNPESWADYVNISRTIALSMAALSLIGGAAGDDVPLAQKMRAYSRANALNRSADQSERTMMQRRRYALANQRPEQPEEAMPADLLPYDPLLGTPFEQAVAAAQAEAAAIAQPPAKTIPPVAQSAPPAPAFTPAPAPEFSPEPKPDSAIRYSGPRTNTDQPRPPPSFKDSLLHHSAMPLAPQQNGAPHPA